MAESRTDPSLQDLDRGLVVAAGVLLAVAGVAGFAGLATFGAALLTAARRWYRRAGMAPRDLANLKWQQARAAMEAGTGAWREGEKHVPPPRASVPTR